MKTPAQILASLGSLVSGTEDQTPMSVEDAAALLQTSPQALAAFETAYRNRSDATNGALGLSMRDYLTAVRETRGTDELAAEDIINGVVADLLAQTTVYSYDPRSTETGETSETSETVLVESTPRSENAEPVLAVTAALANAMPEAIRPQLTGDGSIRDIDDLSWPAVLAAYAQWRKTGDEQDYRRFIAGLDTMDLDSVTYQLLGANKTSMGYWFPHLVTACANQSFFRLPATTIAEVPVDLLQLSRMDYTGINETTKAIVDRWAMAAFELDTTQDYFIKTGTYSQKFDFRNARVTAGNEVTELGEYLLYLSSWAVQMAHPFTMVQTEDGTHLIEKPAVAGISTTREWVVREFIEDNTDSLTIYNGMPLRTEFRFFVDLDDAANPASTADPVIGVSPYWEPTTMMTRFTEGLDVDDANMRHDAVTYLAHQDTLMARYHQHVDTVTEHVHEVARQLAISGMTGQWSMDVMHNGTDPVTGDELFYIIDMAEAAHSALIECVDESRRKPAVTDWTLGALKS